MNIQSFIKEMKEINKKNSNIIRWPRKFRIKLQNFDNFKIKEDSINLRKKIYLLLIKYNSGYKISNPNWWIWLKWT